MIAGILNRLGKIGVILGFCIGNAVLTFVTNGNTVPIITIREILIASLGLLLLPKETKLDISDIMPQTKCLPTTSGRLNGAVEEKETVYKLNSVSETISQMAKSYDESATKTLEEEDIVSIEKDAFIDEVLNTIEDLPDNLLYEDIMQSDEKILEDIFSLMQEKSEITNEEFIKLLEKNSSYILGIDSEDEELKTKTEHDISEIVKTINSIYKINKLNIIWKQKEASNKKVLATQLRWCIKSNIITCRRYRRKDRRK